MSGLKDMKSDLTSKEQNNKEENIPILLLSKDLINHINSINENDIEIQNDEKNNKDININYLHSNESSNEEDPSLRISQANNLNSEIYQKNIQNSIFSSKLFQPSIMNSFNGNIPQFINISRENNNMSEIPKNPNNFNPLINNKDNNNYFNNNFFNNNSVQNNMNIMNSCFTMNGKTGWVCSNCKNFNYESK
jgi:hypothetical protein